MEKKVEGGVIVGYIPEEPVEKVEKPVEKAEKPVEEKPKRKSAKK